MIRALLCLMSLTLASGASGQQGEPQDPFRLPRDARELFDRQRQLAAEEALWDTVAARFLTSYPCGALAEAQAAVHSLNRLDPGNPDAERFQLQLDSHRPERLDRTLEAARSFLDRYRESSRVSAAQLASVTQLHAWLAAERQRRAGLRSSTAIARWAPVGASLLIAGLVGAHLWITRRR
ncbi:MAG: hypothetical protein ISR76_07385 [Planctomycetes bacterium]|nr:hypothetical protein [Planctomycetota bacterium]MBL7008805.1 hypothetical protein [Planctomycetota bacterium]